MCMCDLSSAGLRTRIGPEPWLLSTIHGFESRLSFYLSLSLFLSLPSVHLRRTSALEITFLVVADVRNRTRVYRAARAGHEDHGKCGHGQGIRCTNRPGESFLHRPDPISGGLRSRGRGGDRFCWRATSLILMKVIKTVLYVYTQHRPLYNMFHTAKDVGLC